MRVRPYGGSQPIARMWVDITANPTTNAVTAPEEDSLRDLTPFTLRYRAKRNGNTGKVVQNMAVSFQEGVVLPKRTLDRTRFANTLHNWTMNILYLCSTPHLRRPAARRQRHHRCSRHPPSSTCPQRLAVLLRLIIPRRKQLRIRERKRLRVLPVARGPVFPFSALCARRTQRVPRRGNTLAIVKLL